MNRRTFLSTTAAGIAASLVAPAFAQSALEGGRKTIVLVHGAWHGSWCWTPVVERLAAMGFDVFAPDLPGHGVDAEFPAGYLQTPQDLETLVAAPSPLATLTIEDYRTT